MSADEQMGDFWTGEDVWSVARRNAVKHEAIENAEPDPEEAAAIEAMLDETVGPIPEPLEEPEPFGAGPPGAPPGEDSPALKKGPPVP